MVVASGCSNSNHNNDPKQVGTIQCINNSKNSYSVSIKGNTSTSFTLYGQTSKTISVEVGYYSIHVKQLSGYVFYPTEEDYNGYVQYQKSLIVSFPQSGVNN